MAKNRSIVLIAGCGYVGTALGRHLAKAGHTVWGLRRKTGDLSSPLLPLTSDVTDLETLQSLPSQIDTVFYTVSPDHSDEAGYRAAYINGLRNLLEVLKTQAQQPRIFYTSSTAVYAQQSGEWVDESSPATPDYFSGQCLLEGEQYLLNSRFPATVVRLGGIYGPGRIRLIRKVQEGSATYQDGSPRYTNHIHRDDCVGALAHLMTLEQPDSIYLGVDNEPSERRELLSWLAKELGVPPPQVEVSIQAESRQTRNNKRCKNAKLVRSGYTFRYPTFREGYGEILRAVIGQ
ncbi:MAG TPA: SDR family oxidoreductase [Nitrospirales bacterium]|nr:SDR family oxidoreductase [Nitrospirales bacterium]HIN32543.1 SDR family oxidoreductase [Nitrospirales bacterium]